MIIPYLTFAGNCEEAMNLYCQTLGGRVEYLSRYTKETGGEAMDGKVMHVQAAFGNGAICAGDAKNMPENTDAVRLLVHCKSAEEANTIMDAFGKDGKVLQRLMPHPPPDDGGMGGLVRDKFGYTWILTAPNPNK